MTLSFRICTREDMEIVAPILVAAYNFTESRIALLQQYWSLQSDGWWLVSLDETPVGFGGAVDYGPFSYVGMICVHPSVQHRGIGEALTRQILIWGDARACPTLLLNSREQAASLYRRLGFVEEAKVLRFTQNHSIALPDPSPTIGILQESDIPEVAAFDAPYFGANRAKVLAAYLAENTGTAFVNRTESGQITGYMFADAGSIGPWVASTVEVAEQLLIYALTRSFKRYPSVTIPDANSDGQRLLERYGFSQQGMNYYMRRGIAAQFRQLRMVYGEASPALG